MLLYSGDKTGGCMEGSITLEEFEHRVFPQEKPAFSFGKGWRAEARQVFELSLKI